MQMVLVWTKGITEYKSEFKNITFESPEKCSLCGCVKFHKWGKYVRYVIEKGADHRIFIQRICCVKCLKTYSYLPSFCVSGVCYGVDYIMTFLSVLILKLRYELDELKRRAYMFLRRFAEYENLWLVFLRTRALGEYPSLKKERQVKIFTALLEYHKNGTLMPDFLRETGQHFMSAK